MRILMFMCDTRYEIEISFIFRLKRFPYTTHTDTHTHFIPHFPIPSMHLSWYRTQKLIYFVCSAHVPQLSLLVTIVA